MNGNQLKKYALYGIAEIFLVVVGILIALKINTWNDHRKQQETIQSIYSIIKSDLASDLRIFEDIMAFHTNNEAVYKKIMSRKMTREDYNTCNNCVHLLAGFPDVTIEKRGYNLLLENSTIFNPQKNSLYIKVNKFYKNFDSRITVSQDEMAANHDDNWFYWKNNKPWFSAYFSGQVNDDIIDYMLTSDDYVNRVTATHFLLYQKLLNQMKSYRIDAAAIIEELDGKLE